MSLTLMVDSVILKPRESHLDWYNNQAGEGLLCVISYSLSGEEWSY